MNARFGKRLNVGFLLLLGVPFLAAADAIQPEAATITVRVWDRVQMDPAILDRAKQVNEKLFHPMLVQIRWIDCLTDATPENQRCISPAGPNDISVRIYRRRTEERKRWRQKVAGVALPSSVNEGSGFIQVFFDRLEEISRDNKRDTSLALLLGVTMAHELGHLLLPGNQHSFKGIMQDCLGGSNLRLAAKGWMNFTADERRAIRKKVREWSNVSEGWQFAAQH